MTKWTERLFDGDMAKWRVLGWTVWCCISAVVTEVLVIPAPARPARSSADSVQRSDPIVEVGTYAPITVDTTGRLVTSATLDTAAADTCETNIGTSPHAWPVMPKKARATWRAGEPVGNGYWSLAVCWYVPHD